MLWWPRSGHHSILGSGFNCDYLLTCLWIWHLQDV